VCRADRLLRRCHSPGARFGCHSRTMASRQTAWMMSPAYAVGGMFELHVESDASYAVLRMFSSEKHQPRNESASVLRPDRNERIFGVDGAKPRRDARRARARASLTSGPFRLLSGRGGFCSTNWGRGHRYGLKNVPTPIVACQRARAKRLALPARTRWLFNPLSHQPRHARIVRLWTLC
jgi:hypothetical protein